jgi:hypothetical protein
VGVKDGLITFGIGSFLLLLWDLFVVTAGRMYAQATNEVSALEGKFGSLPNLLANVEKSPNGSAPVLTITNLGGIVEKLSVSVKIEGDNQTARHTHYLSGGYDISIPKQDKQSIPIASIRAKSIDGVIWRFPLRTHHEADRRREIKLPSNGNKTVAVKLRIICHPENQNGPIEREIIFHHDGSFEPE